MALALGGRRRPRPSGPSTGWSTPSATTAPGTSTTWPTGSSRTSSTPTSCAYVAAGVWHHWLLHRRPGLPRGDVADGRAGHRLRARPADPPRRDPLGPPRRRHAVAVRAAHRLVVDLPQPALRRSRSPRRSATSGPTGSCRRARLGPRHPRRARRVRPEAPLGDGLVLPGAGRRARRRRRPAAARRPVGRLRDGGPGRPLRGRPAVDHRGRDLRVRCSPTSRGRGPSGPP